jgi:hypothetical protein
MTKIRKRVALRTVRIEYRNIYVCMYVYIDIIIYVNYMIKLPKIRNLSGKRMRFMKNLQININWETLYIQFQE